MVVEKTVQNARVLWSIFLDCNVIFDNENELNLADKISLWIRFKYLSFEIIFYKFRKEKMIMSGSSCF